VKGRVVVSATLPALFEEAAQLISRAAADAIQQRGMYSLALSGGSTPKGLFRLLATAAWRDRIDWSNTHVFWGDDRYVPHTDPRSNFRMTKEALLDHVLIPPNNVHPVPTDVPPDEAALRYGQTLRQVLGKASDFPQLDLNLLGLGENGHAASLFPHRPILHETKLLVRSDFVPEVDMYRITMTAPMINAGRRVVFLIAGESKADVVRDVITGPQQPEQLPAQLINPAHGELIWLLDSSAAAKLPADISSGASR
jgi:6-phosphogluconolactonase